jgi:hypothetical protein
MSLGSIITRASRSAALWTVGVWMPAVILTGGNVWPGALEFAGGWMVGAVVVGLCFGRRRAHSRRGVGSQSTVPASCAGRDELRGSQRRRDELRRLADLWDERDERKGSDDEHARMVEDGRVPAGDGRAAGRA